MHNKTKPDYDVSKLKSYQTYSLLQQSAVALATFVDAPSLPILKTASIGDLSRLKWLLYHYGSDENALNLAAESIEKLNETNGADVLLDLQYSILSNKFRKRND